HHLGRTLVIPQIAMALTLFSAAGMVLKTYWTRMHADLGVQTKNILTFELPVRPGKLKTQEQVTDYNRLIKERLEAIPSVLSVTAAGGFPLVDSGAVRLVVSRRAPGDSSQYPQIRARMVGPGFFETLGAVVLRGRQFDDRDRPKSMPVVMVN